MKQVGWYSVVYKTFHPDHHGENDIPVYIEEEDEEITYASYLARPHGDRFNSSECSES